MTTFVSRFGTFNFEVMPFGLMNAPSNCQRMMNLLFRNFDYVRVYLDNVVIYSASLEDHVQHLIKPFKIIAEAGLKLKPSKCSFAHTRVRLLGHIVDQGRISVDGDKIIAINRAWVPTRDTTQGSFVML